LEILKKRGGSKKQKLVFVNHQNQLKPIREALESQGITSGIYHGSIPVKERGGVFKSFEKGEFEVLLATDMAARGLDTTNVILFNCIVFLIRSGRPCYLV